MATDTLDPILRPADVSHEAQGALPSPGMGTPQPDTPPDDDGRSVAGFVLLGFLLLSLALALVLVRGNSDPDAMPGNDPLSAGAATTIDNEEDSPESTDDETVENLAVEPETDVEPEPTENTDNAEIVNPAGPYVEPTTTLDNGMVTLAGGQPDQATADRIAGEIAAIVGSENVTNNFVLDTRAPTEGAVGLLDSTDSITYVADSFRVDDDSQSHLDLATYVLDQNPDAILTISAHVASRGDELVAAQASQANADRLVVYFSERGIDTSRLIALGLGSAIPADGNAPELPVNQRSYLTISVP